jgi:hypothetical protein
MAKAERASSLLRLRLFAVRIKQGHSEELIRVFPSALGSVMDARIRAPSESTETYHEFGKMFPETANVPDLNDRARFGLCDDLRFGDTPQGQASAAR